MNERPRVLLLESVHNDALAVLRGAGEVVQLDEPGEAAALSAAQAGPVHAVVTRGKGKVTPALLDACDGLVCVARCGVGLDNVDVAAASDRGVKVLNLPGGNAATVAEHAVMLLLAVARGLGPMAGAVRGGRWQERAGYRWDEVGGKTLGLVGLGAIGSRVGAIAQALGMRVAYASPRTRDARFEHVGLDALLREADAVSLHCPLTDATRGMIDADALAAMKPGAVLINTARGALIDGDAVADAVEFGLLAGYGADGYDPQPPPAGDRLIGLANVLVTPHVASLTAGTYRSLCVRSAENVVAVLRGDDPAAGCVFNADALG